MTWLLGLMAGVLLAVMITFNSLLAAYSTPFIASWVAHGIGMVAAFALILSMPLLRTSTDRNGKASAPLWSYLGGIPGAMTVVLAAITVNTSLALSGTLALLLVGQVASSMILDRFGFLGVIKRKLSYRDLLGVSLVLVGSGLFFILGG